jgi:hypothetical protein
MRKEGRRSRKEKGRKEKGRKSSFLKFLML